MFTLWDVSGHLTWFIGYIKEELETGKFMVEHLHRIECDGWLLEISNKGGHTKSKWAANEAM